MHSRFSLDTLCSDLILIKLVWQEYGHSTLSVNVTISNSEQDQFDIFYYPYQLQGAVCACMEMLMAVSSAHLQCDALNFTVQAVRTTLCWQSWRRYARFSFKLPHFIIGRQSVLSPNLNIYPVCILTFYIVWVGMPSIALNSVPMLKINVCSHFQGSESKRRII